jgi:hypothetical protein
MRQGFSCGNHRKAASSRRNPKLFVEQAWLDYCRGCRLAAGYTDYAEDGDFHQGGAGDEDAVGGGVEVGRCDLQAVVEKSKQVVRDHTLEGLAVGVAQPDPQAIEFGPAKKGFALGLEIVREFADEVDGADASEGQFLVFALESKQVDRFDLAKTRRVEIATDGLLVGKHNDNLLVRGGWGTRFQERRRGDCKTPNLPIGESYVMLSRIFLSTYCFC